MRAILRLPACDTGTIPLDERRRHLGQRHEIERPAANRRRADPWTARSAPPRVKARLRATRLSRPIASTCVSASRRAPSLTDIMAMTAATPSTTPSTLSDVRSL